MMDAGGVVLVPVQTPTPTPTRRRRPRRRRARNGRGVGKDDRGIIDPISLSLYDNPKGMIAYDTTLLGTAVGVENESSPEEIYEAMLRNHLLKQKRVYGLRPTVGQDTSISNRLGGRIKLAVNNVCQAARGSVWDRLSPEIPKRGSLRDRIKWPVEAGDLGNEGSNVRRRPLIRRNLLDDTAFAGPKSPVGLKAGKSAGRDPLHSFEGPKPLSVILKRKREASGVTASQTTDEEAQKDKRKRSLGSGISAVAGTTNAVCSPPTKEISSDHVQNNKVVSVAGPVNVVCPPPAKEIASNHAHVAKVDCKSPECVPENALIDGVDMHLIKGMRTMSISASLGDFQRSYAQPQGSTSCIQQCTFFTT